MSLRTCLVFLVAITPLVACGGKTDGDFDGGGGDGGGSDGGPGPGPGPTNGCPQAEPTGGGSCSKLQLECEYGGDARTVCNHVWTCTSSGWDTTFNGDPSCPSTNSPACPASIDGVSPGSVCGDPGTTCNYSTTGATDWCACTFMGGPIQLDGGNPYTWQCSYSQGGACPAVRPRLGTSCSQHDLECDYSVCGVPNGLSVLCNSTTNTWVTGFGSVCAGAN